MHNIATLYGHNVDWTLTSHTSFNHQKHPVI